MKRLIYLINAVLTIICILLLYNLGGALGITPNINLPFGLGSTSSESVTLILKQIKGIAHLLTESFYDEIYFDTGIIQTGIFSRNKRLSVIASGYVKAGFDLSYLGEDDINISERGIRITLPSPQILSLVSNPSDKEIFYSRGDVTQSDQNRINKIINQILRENAIKNRILERAAVSGKMTVDRFLGILGYDKITIEIRKPESTLRGEALISDTFIKNYSGYKDLQTEQLKTEITEYDEFGRIAGVLLKESTIIYPDRFHIKKTRKSGETISEYIQIGNRAILKKPFSGEELSRAEIDSRKFEYMYYIFNKREDFVFHYIRKSKIGEKLYDVLYAIDSVDRWRKFYISCSAGLIEIIEDEVDYGGFKSVRRIFLSNFKKIKGIHIPMRSIIYINGVKSSQIQVKEISLNEAIGRSHFILR